MAYAGQILTNPVSGETIEFVETAADTGGEYLAIELTLTPDGHVPGAHIHPEQEERFEIVAGTMRFKLDGKKIVAGPGETVVVPAGARHKFSNAGEEPVKARVEVRPALKMEELFETTVRLAEEGRTNRKGMPKPVHLSLFVEAYRREVRAPFPPASVVHALMAPLRAIGRLRGHDAAYGAARPLPIGAAAPAAA